MTSGFAGSARSTTRNPLCPVGDERKIADRLHTPGVDRFGLADQGRRGGVAHVEDLEAAVLLGHARQVAGDADPSRIDAARGAAQQVWRHGIGDVDHHDRHRPGGEVGPIALHFDVDGRIRGRPGWH